MLPTLIKALKTDDTLKIVSHLSLPPIDIDLLLYEGQESGMLEVSKDKKNIKLLKNPTELYYNSELLDKIKSIIRHYDRQEANITYNRLFEIACNLNHPNEKYGYLKHDFVCTMHYLEESGDVKFYQINVPAVKDKRPYNEFKFYTFLDHQEYGAKAVSDFIDQFSNKKVK